MAVDLRVVVGLLQRAVDVERAAADLEAAGARGLPVVGEDRPGAGDQDPYPFVFFNLVLAVLVAVQGPLLMMAQNREVAADRAAAEADYRVNLKNELTLERLLLEVDALRRQAGPGGTPPPAG